MARVQILRGTLLCHALLNPVFKTVYRYLSRDQSCKKDSHNYFDKNRFSRLKSDRDYFILNLNSGHETLWKAVWTFDGKKVHSSANKQNVTRYVCRNIICRHCSLAVSSQKTTDTLAFKQFRYPCPNVPVEVNTADQQFRPTLNVSC